MTIKTLAKRTGKFLLYLSGVLLLLLISLLIFINTNYGKRLIKDKAVSYLQHKLNTTVSIQSIDFSIPRWIELNTVFISDRQKDTLLFGETIKVDLNMFKLVSGDIDIQKVLLKNIYANLYNSPTDSTFNYQFIADAFTDSAAVIAADDSSTLSMVLDQLVLSSIKLNYKDNYAGNILYAAVDTLNAKFKQFDPVNLKFNINELYNDGLLVRSNTTKASEPDTTAAASSLQVQVNAGDIRLANVAVEMNNEVNGMRYSNQVSQVRLTNGSVDLAAEKASFDKFVLDSSSIVFIAPKLSTGNLPANSDNSSNWVFEANEIRLNNDAFTYDDGNSPPAGGLDPAHLQLQRVNLLLQKIAYSPSRTIADLKQLSFADKSGFSIEDAHAGIIYSDTGIHASDLLVKTPQSLIEGNANISSNDISRLTTAPDSSSISLALKNTTIAVNDLYRLAPYIKKSMPPEQFAGNRIQLNTAIHGNLAQLTVPYLQLKGFSGTELNAKATLYHITDSNRLAYDIVVFNSRIPRQDLVKFLPAEQARQAASFPQLLTVNNTRFKGNLKQVTTAVDINSNGLVLAASGSVQHFDQPGRLTYDIDIKNAVVQKDFLLALVADTAISNQFNLPGVTTIRGTAKGDMDNVNTHLTIGGSDGSASLKGFVHHFKNKETATYDLQVSTTALKLGKLLKQDSLLGDLSLEFAAKGKGYDVKTMVAEAKGTINSAILYGHNYQDAMVHASINHGTISSNGNINDSALRLQYVVNADLGKDYPSAVEASIRVDTIQLQRLHLYADTLNASAAIHLTAADLDPHQLEVVLRIDSTKIRTAAGNYALDSIVAIAGTENELHHFTLQSQLADITASGKFEYDAIVPSLVQYIDRYYDITDLVNRSPDPQQIRFDALVKKHPLIADISGGLDYDDIHLEGAYSSDAVDSSLQLQVTAPHLAYQSTAIENSRLELGSSTEKIEATVNFDELAMGSSKLYATELTAGLMHDSISVDAVTRDPKNNDRFALGANISNKNDSYAVSLKDELLLNYKPWTVNPGNRLMYSPAGVMAKDFILTRNEEKISIRSREQQLNSPIDVTIDSFDIRDITSILNNDSLSASGVLNGTFTVSDFNKKLPAFTGDLSLNRLAYRQQPIGNITLTTGLKNENMIDANLQLAGNGNDVAVTGAYFLNNSDKQFDASMEIRSLKMRSIQAFSQNSLSNTSGTVSGKLAVNGQFSDPRWNGAINFDSTRFTLTDFGSTYSIDQQKLVFNYPTISLNRFTIKDSTNHSVVLDGTIKSNTLYDYDLNLNIDANDFILVNTPKVINNQVYGFAAANADIAISGNTTSPTIEGSLSLTDKTDVTIVLPERNVNKDAARTVVRFIDTDTFPLPDTTAFVPATEPTASANFARFLNYNLNIETSKKAALTIIIDPATGDAIKVQGDAHLNAGVDPGGNIVLAGTYELNSGYYELNYQFLKKKFNLLPGSTITFSGNPMNAEVNISAAYIANTSAKELLGNEVGEADPKVSNTFNQKIPFRVILHLKGELQKPLISFDIELPDENTAAISNELRTTVDNKLDQIRADEAATNKQVFSLLLLGRFTGEQSTDFFSGSGGGGNLSDVARESVSKFLSAALDQIASDLFKGVNVDLNLNTYKDYSSGDEQQRTDLNVALSKSFANDRISITVGKNFGIEGQDATAKSTQQRNNSYLPDVTVNYKLTKDGKYMLKLYKKDQFEVILDGYVVETGLAFILTMDYDKFSELFK